MKVQVLSMDLDNYETGQGLSHEPLPVYVINRISDEDRLTRMSQQLQSLGVPWKRVNAVDGRDIPESAIHQINQRSKLRPLSAGEIGCLQSHLQVWTMVASDTIPAAVVLEDDVILAEAFRTMVYMPHAFEGIQAIVRLETYNMPVIIGQPSLHIGTSAACQLRSYQWGSAGYVLTPKLAAELISLYNKETDTADGMLYRYPWRHRILQLVPALCIQSDRMATASGAPAHTSGLMSERMTAIANSRIKPAYLFKQCVWRLLAVALIARDIAMGYSYRAVPFGKPCD